MSIAYRKLINKGLKSLKIRKIYDIAYQEAQNYWSSLTEEQRQKRLEQVVWDIRQGKYVLTTGLTEEHLGSAEYKNHRQTEFNRNLECFSTGNDRDGSVWTIRAGKMTSDTPHLVPFPIIDDFAEKVDLYNDNKEVNIKISEPREMEWSNRKGINYFEKNRIEQVELASEGALVIRKNIGQEVIVSDQSITNNQCLQAVRTIKSSLNQKELNINSNSVSTETPKEPNNFLKIGGGVLVGGLVAGFGLLIRKRNKKKH